MASDQRSSGYEQLVHEIDRVVASPYPTQLKELRDIVCLRCSDTDILRWTLSRPCQVDALAQIVLEARQQGPYILDLLTRLCEHVNLRDAMLRYEPTLLYETVSRAVDGAHDSWKHNAAAIAMLSHRLPDNVTLPAATQSFLLGICDHAAQNPSAKTLKPVYMLLKGALRMLVGLLPSDTLTRLENHFLDILKSTNNSEDHSLSLYCLATMKIVVDAATEEPIGCSGSFYDTQELLAGTPSSPRWKPNAMQQFFTGNKANKTLQLIALRVLWACKASTSEAIDEMSVCLDLANELAEALPASVRETWCRENDLIVRKTHEKVMHEGIDSRIQLPVFAFLCKLCSSSDMLTAVAESMSNSIRSQLRSSTEFTVEGSAMKTCLTAVSVNSITGIYSAITAFGRSAGPCDLSKHSKTIVEILRSLSETLPKSGAVSAGILTAMASRDFHMDMLQLHDLLRSDCVDFTGASVGVCAAAVHHTRAEVIQRICELSLEIGMLRNDQDHKISSELTSLLLNTYKLSLQNRVSCRHGYAKLRKRPSLSPPEEDSMASLDRYEIKGDWRNALSTHLQSKLGSEHDSLVRMFSAACHDLEIRCETVEQPLREEKEKAVALTTKVDDLERELSVSQEQCSAATVHGDDLKVELSRYVQELDSAHDENEKMIDRITELEDELREIQADAAEKLATLQKQREMDDLQHAAAISRMQEDHEDTQVQLTTVKEQLEDERTRRVELEHALKQQKVECTGLRSEKNARDSMNQELNGTISALEQYKQEACMRIGEVQEAERVAATECVLLRSALDKARHDIDTTRKMHEENLNDLAHQASVELRNAVEANENQRSQLQAEHKAVLQQAEDRRAALEQDLRSTTERFSAQVARRDEKLAETTKEVIRLRKSCTEKDQQITQANAMRSNLMAAMGIGGSEQIQTRSMQSKNQTPRVDNHEESFDISSMAASFAEVGDVTQTEIAMAETLAGPTQDDRSPKRPRPRRSVRAGSPLAEPRVSLSSRLARKSLQGRASIGRQPLGAISGNTNLSPPKSAKRTPLSRTVKEVFDELDDSTIDMRGVYTSTLRQRREADGELPEDESAFG